jgi:hypothetical protein
MLANAFSGKQHDAWHGQEADTELKTSPVVVAMIIYELSMGALVFLLTKYINFLIIIDIPAFVVCSNHYYYTSNSIALK